MKTRLIIFSFLIVMNVYSSLAQVAGIYVGGHFRRERPKTITNLKASGFSYVILFNINVEANGNLTTDGETICSNGTYVFGNTQPNYIADVTSLKQGVTSIKRVETCIGGWGNTSYTNIRNLVNSQGTGTGSILYRNFQALKKAIPSMDAINNDDEGAYDVNSATAFHVMLADLGFKTTLAPYMNKPYWQQLATNVNNQRPGTVDRIYLQWYDGGAGNNPCDWNINNITMHTGDLNYENSNTVNTKMTNAKNNCGSKGGFLWVYNDENINLRELAGRINTIFGGTDVTRGEVATFYGDCNYGGSAIGLPEGTFTRAQLQSYGIADNSLSSIQVDPGYVVMVFVDDNFSGANYSASASDNCLVDNGMNDNITSIQIVAKGVAGKGGTYYIRNRGSRLYMDVQGADVTDGTDLLQWSGSFSDNQQFTLIDLGNGIYRINGVKSGKSFDIDGQNPMNAAQLQIWSYFGSYNQQYILVQNDEGYYQLIARHSGMALKVEGSSNSTGAKIKQAINDESNHTQWLLTPVNSTGPITFYSDCNYGGYKVSLPEGSYSMKDLVSKGISDDDIASLQVAQGFVVRLYQDDNLTGTNYLVSASDNCLDNNNASNNTTSLFIRPDGVTDVAGTYYLQNRNSGLFMDVTGGTGAVNDGANIQQFTGTNADNQKFEFIHLGNGVYKVLAVNSKKSLDIEGGPGTINDGANVQQYTYNGASSQQFIVVATGDGYYKLVARNSGKIVEVAGASTTIEANVQQWTNNNQTCGQWNFKPVQLAFNTGDGLRADYFNGQNFETWKINRVDASINFDWGNGSPNANVDADNFSARWTGKIQTRYTGTYTFYINSDNGRRLRINNQLIIDNWLNNAGTEYIGTIALEAGKKYDIVFEYFEATGGASSKLEWSSTSQAREVVPQGQLYSDKAPSVSITSPTNNANYVATAAITINATAADADGSVAKVEFYNGTIKLGEDATSPYTFNWTNVAVGTYTITSRAIDNQGVFTNATPITVKVNANQTPTVTITSPASNATFTSPASITINATAADADGTVSKVEFYNGATKIGEDVTSPYSFVWTSVAKGTYTVTAKAIDDKNGSSVSTAVAIVVNVPNLAPVVAITSPVNNAIYVATASITINANATDDGSINKVEFYNGTTKLGEDASSPYFYNWTNVAVGTYTITVKAYDNLGLSTSSTAIIVKVNANQNPILTASATSAAPNTVSISASATDGDGTIVKVEYYDGITKIGESVSLPYTYSWTNVTAGSHSITAVAIDDKGGKTISGAIVLTVANSNQIPNVSITSPLNNSTFDAGTTITITANVSDGDGSITKVVFYNGTIKIGEGVTSPYSIVFTSLSSGIYEITAKAYDDKDESSISEPVSIIVNLPTDVTNSLFSVSTVILYPVPTNSMLYISGADEESSLEIMNSLGLIVKRGNGYKVNVEELSSGMYHLLIKSKEQTIVKSFIKE